MTHNGDKNAMAQLILPIFAKASTVSVLEQALATGVLKDIDRICWVYIIDDGTLAYVDPDKQVYKIMGANKKLVNQLNSLPPVSEGDKEVLYVVDDIVYTFNGEEYKPTFYEVKIEVDALKTQVERIDTRLDIAETNIATQQETLANLGVSINAVQAELSNKADKDDVYTKNTIDTLLSLKADSDSVYSRTYLDNAFATKADADEVYSKSEVNAALNDKADKTDTYTKDEIDSKTTVVIPGTVEPITITEYVNHSASEAVQNANDYTDEQIKIHFV